MVYVQEGGCIRGQVVRIRAALARKPDALIASIIDNTAFDDVIRRAQGDSVIASNIVALDRCCGQSATVFHRAKV